MKLYLKTILAAMFLLPAMAYAQEEESDSIDVVQAYTDSLTALRNSKYKALDRLSRNTSIRRLNVDYRKLFTPLTFYHEVATTLFDIDRDSEDVSDADALQYVYIYHPEMVAVTQKDLESSGSIIKQKDTKEKVNTSPISNDKTAGLDITPEVENIDIVVKKPNFWKFGATLAMNFQQFKFSKNWYQGGQEYYTQLSVLTLTANYNNKKKLSLSNSLEIRYGSQHTPSDTVHSVRATDEYIRYIGDIAYVAFKNWNYSMRVQAETPMMQHFNANSKVVTSDFMSPLRLSVSPGLKNKFNFWKGKFTGEIQISPISWSYIFCDRENLAPRFGIKKHRHNITKGSRFDIKWEIHPFNNFVWSGKGWVYGPQYERTEIQMENNFSYKMNKYFAITLLLNLRYDDTRQRDKELGYWQYKENLVFSVNYTF